ncbi:MAG TPA: twin-arginine translocase TatA/TatE family subunit [Actinomycetota bacterium]|jgi:Tat protein translocase TatB subunit|nr:twin-arginine translocase TatA/TatE family subunit [Actinomycetota bacterium]
MPQLGPMELVVIAALALILFGPDKLPRLARQAGRYAAELRRIAGDVRDEFETGLAVEDEEGDEIVVPEESFEEPDEPAKDKPADPDAVER